MIMLAGILEDGIEKSIWQDETGYEISPCQVDTMKVGFKVEVVGLKKRE